MKAKSAILSDTEQVTRHIAGLEPALAKTVEMIRQIILAADPQIGERIKWNNPSFYFTGPMKEFDPKEYKRDMIVMNLHKGRIMLVFPSGAKLNDTTGFLQGDYADGRRVKIFSGPDDVQAGKAMLQQLVKQWISLVDT